MKRSEIKRTGFNRKLPSDAPRTPVAARSTLKPSGTLKRTPLAKESPKTRKERPQRQAVIALVHERDDERCQAAELVPSIQCGGPLDVHERWTRGRFPGAHLDAGLAVLLCRQHHDFCSLEPAKAQALGLVKWSWEPLPDQPYDEEANQ